jgi:hypothetical protein
VLSLAAVSAESHYGISLISQGVVTTPPDRPFPPLPGNGGFIAPPGTGPPPAPPAGSGASVLRKVLDGIRLTFSSPARAARAAGLWLLLAAPLILVIRRRAFGRGGGPS